MPKFISGLLACWLLSPAHAQGHGDPTRRDVLKCAILLGAGVAANTVAAVSLDRFGRGPYSQSVAETNLLAIGKIILAELVPFETGNVSLTNDMILRMIKKDPGSFFRQAAVIAPIREEVIFRFMPYFLFGDSWATGLLAADGFAAVHNLNQDKPDLSAIPLTQFIGGVFYWYLLRERGIDHAILAHAANNNIAYVAKYLQSRFP